MHDMNNESSYLDSLQPEDLLLDKNGHQMDEVVNDESVVGGYGSDDSDGSRNNVNVNEESIGSGATIIPNTPTSAASTRLSVINAVGNVATTSTTETVTNSPSREIAHEKLHRIYINQVRLHDNDDEGEVTEILEDTQIDDDVSNVGTDGEDDEAYQGFADNELTVLCTTSTETPATIDEIILLETLQRYYGYLCIILNGVFILSLLSLFTGIYVFLLVFSLFYTYWVNPFREPPAQRRVGA